MKKYLLFLTSSGLLMVFGFTGFVGMVKPNSSNVKKISHKVNPDQPFALNRQLLSLELEKRKITEMTEMESGVSRERFLQNISELPLMFQKNMGQWRKEVLYRASTPSTQVGFRKNGITFFEFREVEEDYDDDHHDRDEEANEDDEKEEHEVYESMTWNLNFKGMNSPIQIVAEGEVAGVTNYLLGNDSTKWVRNTPESRLINYKEIYDNIDLHYYGLDNHKLKYDYLVKPGGNIQSIQMVLDGAGGLKVNDKGELIINTPWGKVAEDKPFSYQVINGVKKEIDVRYQILDDSTFGFKAYGTYDTNYDLVIDPKVLVWNTFTKGSGAAHYVQNIAIDPSRNSYCTGWTDNNFLIVSGVQTTLGGGGSPPLDAWVCKFNRFGTQLLYCTYLGGNGDDRGFGIAANAAGNAFVIGHTLSSDFPMSNAFDGTLGGSGDAFISVLTPAGTGFSYSTYFGGGGNDKGHAIFIDGSSQAYITGLGRAQASFPTTAGVYLPAPGGGGDDVFVARLSAGGATQFCTLLGGSGDEQGNGIYVSPAGEIYVTGDTNGSFLMIGGYDASANGGLDAFVAKLNANVTSVIYSTYLGGGGDDQGYAICVRNDEAYVSGTCAAGFPPTTGAFKTTFGGGTYDAFVTKLNTTGSGLVYSTYLGGSLDEGGVHGDYKGTDIEVNNNGEAYVSGITESTNFPVINGFDMIAGGNAHLDGFISLLSANGGSLLCSTYMGGDQDDYKTLRLALDLSNPLQDTLYASLTVHSLTTAEGGIYPVAQGQGNVYSRLKVTNAGSDQVAVFKMYSCMVPLPVELVSFKAWNKGNYNLLEWTTATEKNNDYFSIERSTDGINFLVIGMVDGAGNSNSVLNYSYLDQKEGDEIAYYRLKQTDDNGQISYSDVVVVNAPEGNKALELTIVSPVTDHLNYKVCCLHKGDARVEVVDLSGKVVISTNTHVTEGYNNQTLDVKTLPSGLYILKFTANNGTVKAKFVK